MENKGKEKEAKSKALLRRHTTGAVTFGESSDVSIETDDEAPTPGETPYERLMRHTSVLFAGGVAGSVGKTATAPLSRLTILFQVHSMVSTRHTDRYSSSVTGAFNKVVKQEGLRAFWKGNGASVLHRFPYSAVNFFTFELTKTSIIAKKHPKLMEGYALTNFLSGAIAGATATIACYPIDLIRTRLATQLDSDRRYTGIMHAAKRIFAEEGARGLYCGLGATLAVTVPNLAINFMLYEKSKNLARRFRQSLLDRKGDTADFNEDSEDEVSLTVVDTLLCGGVAGIASSLVTFPVDVVRRRLQISAIYTQEGVSPSVFGIAKDLFTTQGVRGFYRGLAPELMKVVPMVGITFGTFEQLKDIFTIN